MSGCHNPDCNYIDINKKLDQLQRIDGILRDKIDKLENHNIQHQIKRIADLESEVSCLSPLHEAHNSLHYELDKEIRRLKKTIEDLVSKDVMSNSVYIDTKKLHICKSCSFHRFYIYTKDDKIIGECEKCKTEWVD